MIIEFEGKYIDKEKLKREQLLIKKIVSIEIMECLEKYGFVQKNNYFEHERTLLKAKIKISSKV